MSLLWLQIRMSNAPWCQAHSYYLLVSQTTAGWLWWAKVAWKSVVHGVPVVLVMSESSWCLSRHILTIIEAISVFLDCDKYQDSAAASSWDEHEASQVVWKACRPFVSSWSTSILMSYSYLPPCMSYVTFSFRGKTKVKIGWVWSCQNFQVAWDRAG